MKFLDVPQSGSIAASTHSHNRAGQYTRNRRSPVQPIGTGRRAIVRARFGQASGDWSGLSEVQRASWDSFSADHPVTDSLGQAILLTGHQMFVRVRTTQDNVAMLKQPLPPGNLTLPDLSAVIASYIIGNGLAVSGYEALVGAKIAIAVSRPMSAGRSFNKTFWQPDGADGYTLATASPKNIAEAIYSAEFGIPLLGQKIFVRLTPVSPNGWNGTPAIIPVIAEEL